MRKLLLISVAALSLGACAERFDAQVARFQTLTAPHGQSYFIRPADLRLANSLEFAHYAELIANKLNAQGYQPAGSPESAILSVSVDYHVDKGKTMVRSDPTPAFGLGFGYGGYGGYGYGGYGRFGPWHRGFYGDYAFGYNPYWFGAGYGDVESYTVYTSDLEMKIDEHADGHRVFEGHAEAVSGDNQLTHLVPNLIDAMFTNFPGKSGETVRITVAPPKKH